MGRDKISWVGVTNKRGFHTPRPNETLNKSNNSNSESKLADTSQEFLESAKKHDQTDSKNSILPSIATHEVKSSISTSKSFMGSSESFIIRRCMATIKRFRQLLFSINYILIHKENDDHRDFFELFRQYNVEVFEALLKSLEMKRFSSRNIQLIKAIYNMSTELFNMDIFNQILNANMLSYYGLAEEFSIKVKDSLSKISLNAKKIRLEEDKRIKESDKYYKIFQNSLEKPKKKKLRDTRIFTEPKLNYGARMQLLEYYMQLFYIKGGFSQYSSYEDLIEDKLVEVSDSDEESEFMPPGGKPIVLDHKRFTFSKQPSLRDKRMTTSEKSKHLETQDEKPTPRQSQFYSLVPSVIGGKKDSFNNKDILHENALKSILESPEISERGEDSHNRSGIEYDNRTEEIPLEEEEFSFEDFGFDDPFFTKLGIGNPTAPPPKPLKSLKPPKPPQKSLNSHLKESSSSKDKFWLDVIDQREEEFKKTSLSKFQLKKMRKALETTSRPQILSSLILSAHNPFHSNIPQMANPSLSKPHNPLHPSHPSRHINSSLRNIFYSPEYGRPTGVQSIDNDLSKNGAEHLVYITERMMIPSITEQVYFYKSGKSKGEKEKFRKILKQEVGFIGFINQYEDKKMETVRRLLKKEAKEKAREEYEARKREEEGDLISKNNSFNPYRKELFRTTTQGEVEYQVEVDCDQEQ